MVREIRRAKINPKSSFKNYGAQNTRGRKLREQIRYLLLTFIVGWDSVRGRSGDRIPVGGEIFRTHPERPWGPTSLLYNVYRISSRG